MQASDKRLNIIIRMPVNRRRDVKEREKIYTLILCLMHWPLRGSRRPFHARPLTPLSLSLSLSRFPKYAAAVDS